MYEHQITGMRDRSVLFYSIVITLGNLNLQTFISFYHNRSKTESELEVELVIKNSKNRKRNIIKLVKKITVSD
mgnify:FL=1